MVEGPQCNLKSKKLASLVGQRVRQCSDASLAARLANAGAVLRIVAVGKECFVVFEQLALRLHYAMSGSQCVRDVSSEPQPLPAGSRKQLTLALELDTLAVDLHDCAPPSIRTLNYLASVESRAGRDVIAEEFDRRAVVEKLRADTRPAFDALMDQVSFPGVGNIIKCEALHEAAVSPTILLSELPEARLALLVNVARAFAQRWHEACRRGVGISKRVYGLTACVRVRLPDLPDTGGREEPHHILLPEVSIARGVADASDRAARRLAARMAAAQRHQRCCSRRHCPWRCRRGEG